MKLYSYVVARDFGFAPNPFYGICTLATCKPKIRKSAQIGDWIIGTGSKVNKRDGFLVYVMRVSETMTFNEYWADLRFHRKKPILNGSKKQAFGDNIYFKDQKNQWRQLDSHHSYENGIQNHNNIKNDTQFDRVLISNEYAYWGGSGPKIIDKFRGYDGMDICVGRGYKNKFPDRIINEFINWFQSMDVNGYLDKPLDW